MKTVIQLNRVVVKYLFYPPVCERRAVLNFAFGASILVLMAASF